MKSLITLIFLMTLYTSCDTSSGSSSSHAIAPATAETKLNVAYGNDSAQRMDIYLPAGRTNNTKVMVLIHGGGWASGDKSEFSSAIPVLQHQLPGYAIININYRLATQFGNHFPTQENDVKDALRFVLDKVDEYRVSKDMILLGTSAGAHLALLQAYKNTDLVKPLAAISFFGPTDMAEMYKRQSNSYYQFAIGLLVGGTPDKMPDAFAQASPINFVTSQSVPTLLFHGGKDGLVPVSQSKELKDRLDKAGVPVELVIYPKEGHGWWGATQEDSFKKIAAFLKKHVG
jgi:acetyl esterase/lipase